MNVPSEGTPKPEDRHVRSVLDIKRAAFVTGVAVALLAAGAAEASAHVTVSGTGDVRGGSDAIITFRVPTESDTASTVELKVQLPTDTPLASVLVQPHTGWTSTVTTVKLTTPIKTDDGDITDAVSVIDWKADSVADGIKPTQFDQFNIIVGQLPDVPSLTFKAIQTYSDNSVVSWIEQAAPGSTVEPDHPAPVLTLTPDADASPSATAGSGTTVTASASKGASKSSVTIAIVIAAVGVVLGVAGLGVGLASRRRA